MVSNSHLFEWDSTSKGPKCPLDSTSPSKALDAEEEPVGLIPEQPNALLNNASFQAICSYLRAGTEIKVLRSLSRRHCLLATHWATFSLTWRQWNQRRVDAPLSVNDRFNLCLAMAMISKIHRRYDNVFGLEVDENVLDQVRDATSDAFVDSIRSFSVQGPLRMKKQLGTPGGLVSMGNLVGLRQVILKRVSVTIADFSRLHYLTDLKLHLFRADHILLPNNNALRGNISVSTAYSSFCGVWQTGANVMDDCDLLNELASVFSIPSDFLRQLELHGLQLNHVSISAAINLGSIKSLKDMLIVDATETRGASGCNINFGNNHYNSLRVGPSGVPYKFSVNTKANRFQLLPTKWTEGTALNPISRVKVETHFDILPLSLTERLDYRRVATTILTDIDYQRDVAGLVGQHSFIMMVARPTRAHVARMLTVEGVSRREGVVTQ